MATSHTWKFFRAGGFDQVQIDNGADLLALKELDQKLWVALSCPTRGIEFDTKTLDLIDHDDDAHVHATEVLAAIAWAGNLLRNPDLLIEGSDRVALADINDSSEEGQQLLASAQYILKTLGKADASGDFSRGYGRHREVCRGPGIQRRRRDSCRTDCGCRVARNG